METETTLPSNQGNQNQEQQNGIDDEDDYGMDNNTRQINNYLQEVTLEQEVVLSYGVESPSALGISPHT